MATAKVALVYIDGANVYLYINSIHSYPVL